MNNLKKIFFVVALSMASFSFSQDTEKRADATISSNYCLVLDNTSEVQEFYAADATALGWASELEANKMCGYKSNNLVTYSADYANNKILVQIHTDRSGEKRDITWWNAYLESICKY